MIPASNTRLLTASVTVAMITTAIVVAVFLSSAMQVQKASAQMMAQSPSGRMGPGMMGMMNVGMMGPGMMGPMMMRNQNFTGMMNPNMMGMMGPMMMNPNMMGMMGPMMMRNQNFTGMMTMMTAPNVTGSVPIFSTIAKAISSQVRTGLVNATMTAEKTIGSDAHAISAHIGLQNGFLVYTIWVLDSGNSLHKVIVDTGNGKVLSSQQLPVGPGMMMGMMGPMMMNPNMMGMMGPMMGSPYP